MNKKIAVIRGDGVGPEVVDEALKILRKICDVFSHDFSFEEALAGGSAIDAVGNPLPEETIKIVKNSDAVLLGAVGGPKWDNIESGQRPELAILGLRKELDLFSNLRPAILFEELQNASPLKSKIIGTGLDILIVRELTGGIYFGEKKTYTKNGTEVAYDIEKYSEPEIKRIAKGAFSLARKRNKKLISVDKANVLESSRLWRRIVTDVAKNFPDIELSHMYVDNAAMQIIRTPQSFDVILTNNIFGDILSDEASQITGSIGMLPSASLGESSLGLYEPIHGSAPDIAGTGKANPIATILSVAMMLKYSFSLSKESDAIKKAVKKYLKMGHRTFDIFEKGLILDGTKTAGSKIAEIIEENN
ncbi:MAG: 3-isopropylmalate dehydrogenase [Clostridiales Family XIII bacterium]|jgi:3-isopropylmalate dehydrogenase|nr:3-isopropylmalate dehydrogenase [Clostridiales Family XIII bacterium]